MTKGEHIMSQETLTFLLQLLEAQQLSVSSPEFEETAARVVQARRELVEAIEHGSGA